MTIIAATIRHGSEIHVADIRTATTPQQISLTLQLLELLHPQAHIFTAKI